MADDCVISGSAINELVARLRGILERQGKPGARFVIVVSPRTLDTLRDTFDENTLLPMVLASMSGGWLLQGHHIYLHDDFPFGDLVMTAEHAIVNGAYPT